MKITGEVDNVRIRPVTSGEIDVCLDIFLDASNDLEAKRGRPPIPPEDVAWMPRSITHLLETDPARVLFAIEDEQPVGLGAAYRREDFWFLAYLEIRPQHQGRGIGRALLESLLPPQDRHGSMMLATVVEAIQPVSTMLYARYGIVPRVPLYWLGKPSMFRDLPPLPSGVEGRELAPEQDRSAIDAFDREVLGYARPVDHAMWQRDADRAIAYVHRGEIVGYAYFSNDDDGPWIGPCLGTDERLVAAIVRDVLEAEPDLDEVTIPIGGSAGELLPTLVRAGARADDGAKLLYCSNGPGFPPQYLFYSGFLP